MGIGDTVSLRIDQSVRRWVWLDISTNERDTMPIRDPQQVRDARGRAQLRNRAFIREYLSTHPCVDCGETRWEVLEFDHIKDKKYSISNMIAKSSIATLSAEIEKCEVRCANCHRLKTMKQFNHYKGDWETNPKTPPPYHPKVGGHAVGEEAHRAKLTEEQVLAIRAEYIPNEVGCVSLGKKYGVSRGCIWRIINRLTWTHI